MSGGLPHESKLQQPAAQYGAKTIHECFAVFDTSTLRPQVDVLRL